MRAFEGAREFATLAMTAHTTTDKTRSRPNRSLIALALGGGMLLGLWGGVPARAQGYYGQPMISERAVTALLHRQGFSRMSLPVLNRDVYVLDAIDPYGQPMRIIISAFNGHIVAAHPQRYRPGVMIDPDEDDDLPAPPRRRDWTRHEPDVWPQQRLETLEPGVAPRQPLPPVPKRTQPPPRESSNALPALPAPPAAEKLTPTAPTPKTPTVIKRSPAALPKEPDTARLPPAPGVGTRDKPRVIDLAPKPAAPADEPKAAPPSAAIPSPAPRLDRPEPAPQPAPEARPAPPAPDMTPQAAAPAPAPTPALPPAVTRTPDASSTIKDYRTIPPATLE